MIVNLTQHAATIEQVAAGVVDLSAEGRALLAEFLTFESLPTKAEIQDAAQSIARLAHLPKYRADAEPVSVSMIGGAPFLMSALEAALMDVGIQPIYAFSRRESAEQVQADGSVRKVNVFRHAGFVGL